MGELGSSALKSQKSNKVVKGGGLGLEQGHVTLLRPQNVPDGFKQCHLKAPYVTEKTDQGREGRRGRGGGESWEKKTTRPPRGQGWTCPKGRALEPETLGSIEGAGPALLPDAWLRGGWRQRSQQDAF